MKKLAAVSFVILLMAVVIGQKGCHYYGLAEPQPAYPCQHQPTDTLRMAFIGDSWAFMHQPYDDSLAQHISRLTGCPVAVSSYGLCGKTSKEVYLSLFSDSILRQLISSGPHYGIVSVGINDSYKKMSSQYYVSHTLLIVRFLLHSGITPILMELPHYDIQQAYERQTWSRKTLRQLSMLLTGSQLDCRSAYRQALRDALREGGLSSQVTLLPAMPADWSLWQPDRMHLNKKGYASLDTCIATIVSEKRSSLTSSSAGRESQ